MSKNNPSIFDLLFADIKDKAKKGDVENSYTAFLINKGPEKVAKKVTEEAFELAIASLEGKSHKSGKEQMVAEAADLFFHVLVLLASKNVELNEVMTELEVRMKAKNLSKKSIEKNKHK